MIHVCKYFVQFQPKKLEEKTMKSGLCKRWKEEKITMKWNLNFCSFTSSNKPEYIHIMWKYSPCLTLTLVLGYNKKLKEQYKSNTSTYTQNKVLACLAPLSRKWSALLLLVATPSSTFLSANNPLNHPPPEDMSTGVIAGTSSGIGISSGGALHHTLYPTN